MEMGHGSYNKEWRKVPSASENILNECICRDNGVERNNNTPHEATIHLENSYLRTLFVQSLQGGSKE